MQDARRRQAHSAKPITDVWIGAGVIDCQVNIPGDLKPDGTYSLGGIPPGKYRIAAVDMFSMVGLADEEGFKKIYERGEEIELKPGDRVRKDVRTIPKEDTGAKPKQ